MVELQVLQIHDGQELQQDFRDVMELLDDHSLTRLSLSSVDGLSVDLFNDIGTRFKALQTLELFQCLGSRITAVLNQDLMFENLTTLFIEDVNFVESIISSVLMKSPNLLYLNYSGQVPAREIYKSTIHNPKLRSLSIMDIKFEVEDHYDFENFCKKHPYLQNVNLANHAGLYYPMEYLLAMGKYLPRLESLFIDSSNIDDELLNNITLNKVFKTVQISSCPSITSAGFKTLFQSLDSKSPLRLEFSRCQEFNDSVIKVLSLFNNISSLRLFDTLLSMPVLEGFIRNQKRLEVLHLSNVYSQDEVERLSKLMPKGGRVKLSISKMFD
jgi:hypothetical protein